MAILESNLWRSVVIIPAIVGLVYAITRLSDLWTGLLVSLFMVGLLGVYLYKQKELKAHTAVSGSDRDEVSGTITNIDSNGSPLQELYDGDENQRLIYWELTEYQTSGRFNLWVKRAAGITGGDVTVEEDDRETTVDLPSIGIAKKYSFLNKLAVGSFGQTENGATNFGNLYVDMPKGTMFRTIEIDSSESPPEPIAQLLDSTSNISSDSLDPLASNILGAKNVRGDRRFNFREIPVESDLYVNGSAGGSTDFGSDVIHVDSEKLSILTPQPKDAFVPHLEDKITVLKIILSAFVLSSLLVLALFVV